MTTSYAPMVRRGPDGGAAGQAYGRGMPKAPDTAAAISISGLVKDFGTTRALDHLDLNVRRGEVHGFLGPNGG
jgi:hypothetical protein